MVLSPQDVLVENPPDNRPQDVSQGSSDPQASQEKGFTIVELPSASGPSDIQALTEHLHRRTYLLNQAAGGGAIGVIYCHVKASPQVEIARTCLYTCIWDGCTRVRVCNGTGMYASHINVQLHWHGAVMKVRHAHDTASSQCGPIHE